MKKIKLTVIIILTVMISVYVSVFTILYNHHRSSFILCEKGSYAEEYAKTNNVDYSVAADSITDVMKLEYEQFSYTASGIECRILSYNGKSEEITIPVIIDGHIVTSVAKDAFDGSANLRRVYVPDTVLSFEAVDLEDITVYCSVNSPTYRQLEYARSEAQAKADAENAKTEETEPVSDLTTEIAETDTEDAVSGADGVSSVTEAKETDTATVETDVETTEGPAETKEPVLPKKTTDFKEWIADSESELPFEYNRLSNGIEIVSYNGNDEYIVVPYSLNGDQVVKISFPVLRAGVKAVFIPSTVKEIDSDFSTPRYDAPFIINIAIVFVGFILALAATLIACKNEDSMSKKFLGVSVVYTGIKYFTVLFVVSAVSAFFGFGKWIQIIAAIVLTALGVIELVKAKTAADIVDSVDKKVKEKAFFIKNLTVDAESILERAKSDTVKTECKKVYEAVRYSDPMSNDALSVIEAKITVKMDDFSFAVTEDKAKEVKEIAEEIIILIGDRNKKCKALK